MEYVGLVSCSKIGKCRLQDKKSQLSCQIADTHINSLMLSPGACGVGTGTIFNFRKFTLSEVERFPKSKGIDVR